MQISSSNKDIFEQTKNEFRQKLLLNAYPLSLINKLFYQFENPKPIDKDYSTKDKILIKIQYGNPVVAKLFISMKKGLEKLLGVKIHIVFSQLRIKNLISKNLKFVESDLRSQNIVYEYTCCCPSKPQYIGETSLRLECRIKSHISQGLLSGIIKHTENCVQFKERYQAYSLEHDKEISSKENLACFMNTLFKIKKRCKSNKDRKWHECLLIRKHSPSLNLREEFLPQVII